MDISNKKIETLSDVSITRRSFLQSIGAIGAGAAIAGCSKDDTNDFLTNMGGESS